MLTHSSKLALVILLGSLLGAAPSGAVVQKGESGPAFVDVGRVLNVYRKTQAFAKAQQQFAEKEKALGEEMSFLAQIRFCTPEETKQALAIRTKGETASAADKAKLAEFKKRVDDIENELTRLSQKEKPTDAETKRLQELSTKRTESAQTLAEAAAERREQLRELDAQLLESVQEEIMKVVEKVAKEAKIPVVYNRTAVLVGGNDLTEQVIRKLGK